ILRDQLRPPRTLRPMTREVEEQVGALRVLEELSQQRAECRAVDGFRCTRVQVHRVIEAAILIALQNGSHRLSVSHVSRERMMHVIVNSYQERSLHSAATPMSTCPVSSQWRQSPSESHWWRE